MKRIHAIIILVAGLIIFTGFGLSANAAESLPPGLVIADENGIHANEKGKYFIEHNEIKPELTFERAIMISNYGIEEKPYRLSLRFSEGDDNHSSFKEGKIDLNRAISVTMTMNGKTLYAGDLIGNGLPDAKNKAIDLGTFKPGQTETLNVNFFVRNDSDDDWSEISQSDFYWVFYASEDTKLQPDPKPSKPFGIFPQTGEDLRNVLLGFILGLLFISLVIVVTIKRNRNRRR